MGIGIWVCIFVGFIVVWWAHHYELLPGWVYYIALGDVVAALLISMMIIWVLGIPVQWGYMSALQYADGDVLFGSLFWPVYWLASLGVWLAT